MPPVNTDYLMKADWWGIGSSRPDATWCPKYSKPHAYTVFPGIQNDPQHLFCLVTSPKKESLTPAMAITELVPSHVLLNAVKIADPYGPGLAATVMERKTEAQSTWHFRPRSTTEIPTKPWRCVPTSGKCYVMDFHYRSHWSDSVRLHQSKMY